MSARGDGNTTRETCPLCGATLHGRGLPYHFREANCEVAGE